MMDPNRDDPLEEGGQDRPEQEVVPAISSEQLDSDNDQDSHVAPSDNDGETVPQDEVIDQVGG